MRDPESKAALPIGAVDEEPLDKSGSKWYLRLHIDFAQHPGEVVHVAVHILLDNRNVDVFDDYTIACTTVLDEYSSEDLVIHNEVLACLE